MSRFASELNVGHALVSLCQESGARSGIVQRGAELVESNLPMAEARANDIAGVIHEMVTSYQEVGRTLESAFFGFGENLMLVVSEGEVCVSLIFPAAHSQLVEATAMCRRFLRDHRASILLFRSGGGGNGLSQVAPEAKVAKAWETFQPKLKTLLSRVIPGSQAERMIHHLLESKNLLDGPEDADVPAISREVIMKVGHRGKQQALLAELKDILAEAGLD